MSSDPDLRFSTDVTEVIESLKNSGYAATNGDIVLLGAALCFKFGYSEFASTSQNYVRLGVLLRQANFESFAIALIIANKHKNSEDISEETLILEKNIGYLARMANSGLVHLRNKLKDFERDLSEILPEMIKDALGLSSSNLSKEAFSGMASEIIFAEGENKENE